jgi:hypothetical protein
LTPPSASPSPATAASAATQASPTADLIPVDAPAILQVGCDGTRTTIVLPIVRAQRDGVHLKFSNTSGKELAYSVEDVGGDSVPAAGLSVIERFAPGTYKVSCAADLLAFEVVDPAGFYTPAACADPGSGTTGTSDYVQGATGLRGTPIEVARRQLRGLAPGDVVELGGYPLAPASLASPTVVVIRQGVVLAVLTYEADGKGGWLASTMRTCAGADITLGS